MELKKGKGRTDAQPSVYAQIVDTFGDDIPMMKTVPRQEESTDIHFRGMGRLAQQAEEVALRSKRKFRTAADVHRAAHYLGMSIIYHLVGMQDSTKYKALNSLEDLYILMQDVDDALESIGIYVKACKDGYMSEEELVEKYEDLLETFKPDVRENIQMQIQEISKATNIPAMMKMRRSGRPPVVDLGEYKSSRG